MLVQISTEEIREMEREEAWQPTKGVPVIDEDITEVLHQTCSLSAKSTNASYVVSLMTLTNTRTSNIEIWTDSRAAFYHPDYIFLHPCNARHAADHCLVVGVCPLIGTQLSGIL